MQINMLGNMDDSLEVSSSKPIAYVIFHNHGNMIGFDDFEYETYQDCTNGDCSIPEFPTVALPVIAVIGLVFLFQRRKGK